MVAFALRGYYAILDIKSPSPPTASAVVERARKLLAAGPCCLQIRAKRLRAVELQALAEAILPACRAARVPLCVNDRVDVALAVGAEAAHLGQDDLPLADARRICAGRAIRLGVSTHDEDQARAADTGGADYVAFGPVFPTPTKDRPEPVVGLAALRRVASAVRAPVVAIGGITMDTVGLVAEAGAAAAAVISAIETAPDVTATARRVSAAFQGGQP